MRKMNNRTEETARRRIYKALGDSMAAQITEFIELGFPDSSIREKAAACRRAFEYFSTQEKLAQPEQKKPKEPARLVPKKLEKAGGIPPLKRKKRTKKSQAYEVWEDHEDLRKI